MWIGWPFARSEARVEVRLLAVLVVRAGFPEREQLGEVLDPIERSSTLRLQLGKLVGTPEQHAHGNTLYLADRQGVASLDEPPGRGGRGRIVLDIAWKSPSRSHRRRWLMSRRSRPSHSRSCLSHWSAMIGPHCRARHVR